MVSGLLAGSRTHPLVGRAVELCRFVRSGVLRELRLCRLRLRGLRGLLELLELPIVFDVLQLCTVQ